MRGMGGVSVYRSRHALVWHVERAGQDGQDWNGLALQVTWSVIIVSLSNRSRYQ